MATFLQSGRAILALALNSSLDKLATPSPSFVIPQAAFTLASALNEAFGSDGIPDSVAAGLGGLADNLAYNLNAAEVLDNARGAAIRETETLRRAKLKAETRAAELSERNDAQGVTINTYRQQRDEQGGRAAKAERELGEKAAALDALELRDCAVAGVLDSMLYDIGALPFKVATDNPPAHSLMRSYLESGAMLAAFVKEAI